MPRFFFDIFDGTDIADREGTDLENVRQAKIEAAKFAASLLKDDPERFWDGHEWTVRVRDENGLQLFEVILFAIDAPVLCGPTGKYR